MDMPRPTKMAAPKYFTKDKIFINTFWDHLKWKHPADQMRRLKLYVCGLDLIRNTHNALVTISSKGDPDMLLHRFCGSTKSDECYCVQIKENKRMNRKDSMSV